MTRRKLLTIVIYTFIVLLIGRNSDFLPRFASSPKPAQENAKLKKEIKRIIDKQTGNYSFYYVNLLNEEYAGINERQVYTAASVNKVPIITVLYYLHNKGKINLDEAIALQKEDIQDYGTGSVRYQKVGTQYSLKTLAKLSLTQSDNTAAHIIAAKIGMDRIQKIITSWGLSQTDMNNNKTSLHDMSLLFRKIYKGEVTSHALTKELLEFLTDSDLEDRLPVLLPKNTIVYHKTAEGLGIMHDSGIIEYNSTVFFIGVMTSHIGDTQTQTKQAIAQIAQKTFEFASRK